MASENVEIARELIKLNRSGLSEDAFEHAGLELAHPEMEFNSRLSSIEGASYRGHDGMRRYRADMSDAWREWRIELEAIEDLGSGRVFARVNMHAVGQSGVAIELRSWIIVEVADEKVRRMDVYASREEAVEAAGSGD
jgi:hypothetical protein